MREHARNARARTAQQLAATSCALRASQDLAELGKKKPCAFGFARPTKKTTLTVPGRAKARRVAGAEVGLAPVPRLGETRSCGSTRCGLEGARGTTFQPGFLALWSWWVDTEFRTLTGSVRIAL